MAKGPRYSVKFRRRREGRTHYKKRVKLASGLVRAVIRKSNKYINIQFVNYKKEGDHTLISVNSNQLPKLGWKGTCKSLPAAYLTGLLAGKLAKEAGITAAVLDIGRITSTKGGRIYAALKGIIDAGVNIPHNPEVLPSEERLSGKHIEKVSKDFDKVKSNVLSSKVIKKEVKKKK